MKDSQLFMLCAAIALCSLRPSGQWMALAFFAASVFMRYTK
jgi:hypothetical protein